MNRHLGLGMTEAKLECLWLLERAGEHGIIDTSPDLVPTRVQNRGRTFRSLLRTGHVTRSMCGVYHLTDKGRRLIARGRE